MERKGSTVERLAGQPYWVLTFEKDGTLTDPDRRTFLDDVATSGVRHLFVLSHGWNNSSADADDLYSSLLPMVAEAAHGAELAHIGLVGIHWPALWFPDRPGTADAAGAGDAQSSQATSLAPPSSGDGALSGPEISEWLRKAFDGEQRDAVDQLGALIEAGEAAAASQVEPDRVQRERVAEFHRLLQRLVDEPGPAAVEDGGETALFDSQAPEADYAFLAETFGGAPEGGAAQSASDDFRKVWKGAKDALRVASYYVMKARAGEVGRRGLGPLLVELHARPDTSAVCVHLIGHSFGGRLVAFALTGIPTADKSPIRSLTLVQAAFSHYAFSEVHGNAFSAPGALREVADRVHGPLVATFSEHDWAVGRWYPRASALARQDNQANPNVSRWGGLGADGFQAVDPFHKGYLLDAGSDYGFSPGHFYGIDGSAFIKNVRQSIFSGAHSDIRHEEVAWLVAAAAAVGAGVPAPTG
jgi:hypothetical protein